MEHLSIQRLLELAGEENPLFTSEEHHHLKICVECLRNWIKLIPPRPIRQQPVTATTFAWSCAQRNRLFSAYRKAVDLHVQLVSEFTKAIGLVAHCELEFLGRRMAAARSVAREAQQEFYKHCREHQC